MGANAYCYFTPYQRDIAQALITLQEQEFLAGRYDPALLAAIPPTYAFRQRFPPTAEFPSPGRQHGSIEEAFMAGMESGEGTGSIIDIRGLTAAPSMLAASPTTHETLCALFTHDKPTHDDVERVLLGMLRATSGPMPSREALLLSASFWEAIGRGEARYFIVYDQGQPAEIFFAGYSID